MGPGFQLRQIRLKLAPRLQGFRLKYFSEKHLMDVITEIDQVYDNIHDNYKVGAVFMDHYTEGVTSPKFYLNTVLNQILKSLQYKVFEKSKLKILLGK